MKKIIKTVDDAINRLNELLAKSIASKSDSELLEILISKDEWDEKFIEMTKQEIQNRNNR